MKEILLHTMSGLYIVAGANHFIQPKLYRRILPPWVPWPRLVIAGSGLCEILLGLLLIPVSTRITAAWGIILLLVLVFPANVQMMLIFRRKKNPWLCLAILRLPLQFVLIGWAYQYTTA